MKCAGPTGRAGEIEGNSEGTEPMKCPFCKQDNDRVVDSRLGNDGAVDPPAARVRRVRPRYTTYERVEETPAARDQEGRVERVRFDRERILAGMMRACEKLPVPIEDLEAHRPSASRPVSRRSTTARCSSR